MTVEHTLAIILPEGMPCAKKILAILKNECFTTLAQRYVQLTPEQTSDFYEFLYGRRDFPLMVAYKSSAPVTVLCLGRVNAVEKLQEIVGPSDVMSAQLEFPTSLNAQFGNFECNLPAVHASRDGSAARKEINFFFPNSFVEPMTRLEAGIRLIEKEVRPLLKEGLSQMAKEKPLEPLLWLADWLLEHNPNQPRVATHLRQERFSEISRSYDYSRDVKGSNPERISE